ncbi:hypothetical protein KA005_77550 [bacterium]|nr:hypothetical protein [bacterium]
MAVCNRSGLDLVSSDNGKVTAVLFAFREGKVFLPEINLDEAEEIYKGWVGI